MSVVVMQLHNASMEATNTQLAYRKKTRHVADDTDLGSTNISFPRHEPDEDLLEPPHEKQIHDMLAWHIETLNAKWYMKPRSTCWFEEYLFNSYTPNMFFDILRMRRVTFDRLV